MLKPGLAGRPARRSCRSMNAIVLCGGGSSRMGFDKAFIRAGGRTLVERQVEALSGRFGKVILATNFPEKYRLRCRVEKVADGVPGLGPIGGLAAVLEKSDSRYNFAVACDRLKLVRLFSRLRRVLSRYGCADKNISCCP